MNLCDSNIWLALALSAHSAHDRAAKWLESKEAPRSLLFCRATQTSLLRLLTNAAVLRPYGNPPLTNRAAWNVYDAFLQDDRIAHRSDEPVGLEPIWKSLASRSSASPKFWMDAYLAAYARAGGLTMVTTDKAFRQFRGLDLVIL